MPRINLITLPAAVFVCISLASCGPKLTPEQQQQLVDIKQQLQTVRQETETAKTAAERYSGGLLKSLLSVRLEVLKTNEALLDQRVQALESGAKVTLVVQAAKDDPIRSAQLAAEIESQQAKLAQAKSEAGRYSGGLIGAMSLVSVATISNTIALLEQQHLIAKYGLAVPMPTATGDATKK